MTGIRLRHAQQSAFTLAEMAVVVVIAGMLILIIYPGLIALRSGAARQATDANLQTLMRATAAYAQAQGCLPCPTPATTTGAGFGHVRGDGAQTAAACAGCASPEGIPPFADLGLPASAAKDAWSRWITMRVDPGLTLPFGVAPPAAGNGQSGLCMAGLSSKNTYVTVTRTGDASQKAAVIFVSHGANGYGAFIASALGSSTNGQRLPFPAAESCATRPEVCNADGNATFVEATPGASFDDSLLYMGRNALISMLGSGACATSW